MVSLALFQSEFTEILAKSLLHTLWQTTAIGLTFLLILKLLPTVKSEVRYKLGLLTLFAVLLSWLGTFSILNQKPTDINPPSASTSPAPALSTPATFEVSSEAFHISENSTVNPRQAPRAEQAERNSKVSTHSILIMIWSTGVFLMIVRLFIALTGTHRHRRKSMPIEDITLLAHFNNLCSRLQIKGKIIFAVTNTLKNPGVIGIVKPMVLIPSSMLTGFSASDLEAVVAHELAHIRRHDYLLNLLQMVIESLLFFNPAVWWISHRIRMEREACCDAEAMQATGQKFEYANLLLYQFGRSPVTVPAFGNNRKKDAKERIMRIVQPQRKIAVKIGCTRLILLLALSSAGIFALAKTSDLAVEAVTKILTPKERVEKLMELADKQPEVPEEPQPPEVDRHDYTGKPRINIFGTVKTADDSALPEKLDVSYTSLETPKSRNWTDRQNAKEYRNNVGVEADGMFSFTNVPALGTQYLNIAAQGFQTLKYETGSAQDISNLEFSLTRAFPVEVIIQNTEGEPIPNASVMLMYPVETVMGITYMHHAPDPQITGANGNLNFENQSTNPIVFKVHAKGYQSLDFFSASFKKNTSLIIQLEKGHIIPGTVTDRQTGEPVQDAQIILMEREVPTYAFDMQGEMMGMSDDREIARTDPSGAFLIDTIGTNATFTITVKAPGKNPSIIKGITTETKHIDIQLRPKRIIRGKLIGDLSKIQDGWIDEQGKSGFHPAVHYTTQHGGGSLQQRTLVTFTNDVGYFEITDIQGNWVEIFLADRDDKHQKQLAEIWFTDRTEYNLTLNLDSDEVQYGPDSRLIEFDIQTPDGFPKAEGSMTIEYVTVEEKESKNKYEVPTSPRTDVDIKDGKGSLQLPAPAYITLYSAKDIKGYWIEPLPTVRRSTLLIEPGTNPYRYEIKATPSGGIHGNVFTADNKPASTFTTWIIFNSDKKRVRTWKFGFIQKNKDAFTTTSIPLHQEFALLVENNAEWITSEPMTLTEDNPILNFDLQFSPAKPIEGRVLNPDGNPASDIYVQLVNSYIISEGFSDYIYANGIMTDNNGYFRWDNVSSDPKFKYRLRLDEQYFPVEPGTNKDYTLKPKK